MRSSTADSCSCGNIEVTGTVVKRISRASAHGSSGASLRIGPQAIAIKSLPDVDISTVGSRSLTVTCRDCGARLSVVNGTSGAVCEMRGGYFDGCRSLPTGAFLSDTHTVIPSVMRGLFKNLDVSSLSADDAGLSGVCDVSEDADYDIMFSGEGDPLVGSYSDLGLFTEDKDYLVFV